MERKFYNPTSTSVRILLGHQLYLIFSLAQHTNTHTFHRQSSISCRGAEHQQERWNVRCFKLKCTHLPGEWNEQVLAVSTWHGNWSRHSSVACLSSVSTRRHHPWRLCVCVCCSDKFCVGYTFPKTWPPSTVYEWFVGVSRWVRVFSKVRSLYLYIIDFDICRKSLNFSWSVRRYVLWGKCGWTSFIDLCIKCTQHIHTHGRIHTPSP